MKDLFRRLRARLHTPPSPPHLQIARLGEHAARRHLRRQGLRFLAANYRSPHGEIDLVFRDRDCLAFVEVKTRSSEAWTRPADAVDRRKQKHLSRAALDYLRTIRNPEIKVRFDIVEVLVDGNQVRAVRHLPNAFELTPPHRYG